MKLSQEDAKKWLDYRERGLKPTRYKLKSVVYSDNALEAFTQFKLNGFELTLAPLSAEHRRFEEIDGFAPAFICEVISGHDSHRGGSNFDLYECLDRVLPVIGFKYRLPLEYSQFEEYEGEWIESVAGGGNVSLQRIHKVIPHPKIQEIISAYESALTRVDKRSKKSVIIRTRLKEALELERVSRRFSFMSYYNILEIISDDLASNKTAAYSNAIAADISKFSLSTKGSQRVKLYFLLQAIDNEFDLDQSIALADVRNDLAHGELSVDWPKLELCKKIAFWASDYFILSMSK